MNKRYHQAIVIIILLWFIGAISTCKADQLIKLSDLSLEATKYFHGRNNNIFDGGTYRERYGLNLNMGLRVSRFDYTRLRLTSATDQRQFRYIALEAETGFHIGQIDLYVNHKSQHLMDDAYEDGFKDDNRIGVRLKLYEEGI